MMVEMGNQILRYSAPAQRGCLRAPHGRSVARYSGIQVFCINTTIAAGHTLTARTFQDLDVKEDQ
jgi:hypothetical protein